MIHQSASYLYVPVLEPKKPKEFIMTCHRKQVGNTIYLI